MTKAVSTKGFHDRLAEGKTEREALVRNTIGELFSRNTSGIKFWMIEASVEEDIENGIDAFLTDGEKMYKSQIKSRDINTGSDLLQDLYENRDGSGWQIARDHPARSQNMYIFLLNAEQDEICIFDGREVKKMLVELIEEYEAAGKPSLMFSRKYERCQVRIWNDPKSKTPKIGAFIPRKYCKMRKPVVK